MYKQLKLIEQVIPPLEKPIDYEIKLLMKKNKMLYEEFEKICEGNCLYDKDSPEYISFKEQITRKITENFLKIYHFCSTDRDCIQEYPILIKSIIQFINQFLLEFPLLTIEKEYVLLAHITLFFKLKCSPSTPLSCCLSQKKKYGKIVEEGKILVEKLETKSVEELLPMLLDFLYQIITFSTLYVKQYTKEEKEIMTTIGYTFLDYYKETEEAKTNPYFLHLDDILNCFFKTYVPTKEKIKVLQKNSKMEYENRLRKLTLHILEQNKKA